MIDLGEHDAARIDELEAEVARLQEELAARDQDRWLTLHREWGDARAKLAAANALLARASADWNRPGLWAKDVADHLAGAAPALKPLTLAEDRKASHYCPQCGVLHVEDDGDGNTVSCIEEDGACRLCGCDTVSWADLLYHLDESGWRVTDVERTEADQAVLDACAAADVRVIGGRAAFWEGAYPVAAAELARRGVKP